MILRLMAGQSLGMVVPNTRLVALPEEGFSEDMISLLQ
jgi:hypothetical protein